MSKAEDAQNAVAHVLELLVREGGSVQTTTSQVALEYDLKPSVVEGWLQRRFPSQDSLDDWLKQACEAKFRRETWKAEQEDVENAALEWTLDVWKNCEPDGQPDWDYCCDRFLNAHIVQKPELRTVARAIFRETGRRFEAARRRYLESQQRK